MIFIKDIVNRDIANLTNCESEPIHIPGSIQPHGFLLGLKADEHIIEFCSANTLDYIPLTPVTLLGKHIEEIFSAPQICDFLSYITEIDPAKPFVFTVNDVNFNTSVHKSGKTWLLEFEPFPDGTLDLPNLYTQTKNFVSLLEKDNPLQGLCVDIAEQIRQITEYDRILIYRFDAEYNGEVFAESKRPDLESFYGQKYPHTDIPAQARELYIRNPLRMIADINYNPVPLLTLDDNTNKNNKSLDLSLSILRSVSPIHIEYLRNMQVGATLTISLLKENKLWGLIACHHYSPKNLPHYVRLSTLLQGHFLTSQIAVREVAEEFKISQLTDKALLQSLSLLHKNEDFIEQDFKSPSLLNLANATGFVIYYDGQLYKNGKVPDTKELVPFLNFLSKNYPNGDFHTQKLVDTYPQGEKFSAFAAGFIYHSLSAANADGILWLRAERHEKISWAGNPNKAVIANGDGLQHLSPRKSFDLWIEEVKNKSEKWRKSEIGASSSFAYALQKHINLRYVAAQEIKHRLLNEELKTSNEELANLNWISAHDLVEPLRKIQVFASIVLSLNAPELSAKIKDYVIRMRLASEKMQLLIGDIMTYSKTANMEKVYETVNLNTLLGQVLEELNDNIEEKNATVTSGELPSLLGIPFQLRQLFINLITNALKFSKKEINPVITVTCKIVAGRDIPVETVEQDPSYYAISVQDNGIGFEQEYAKKIFDVFQRLHSQQAYPGTGMGLAICKKVMTNHKGFITSDSKPDIGTRFTLFFPENLSGPV